MTIGDRIKKLRKDRGMTQEELAKYINSTKQTIYKYENNIITNIPSDKIEKIAKALQTTPSYLMGWDEEINLIKRSLDLLDAKVYFRTALSELIEYFGYEVVDNYAKDNEGNTTVLLEGEKDVFEIKESDYNNFVNNCFSFIDYEFNKMIKEENRIKRNFSIDDYRNKDGKIEKYLYDKLLLNAAHEIEGASQEDKDHDNNIMDDDNF